MPYDPITLLSTLSTIALPPDTQDSLSVSWLDSYRMGFPPMKHYTLCWAHTNRLADDWIKHQGPDIYTKYLNQLTTANNTVKGELTMVCEGILNMCGTSSAEIIANTRKESEAQINELREANKQLSSQNNRLKELLRQNNISFE